MARFVDDPISGSAGADLTTLGWIKATAPASGAAVVTAGGRARPGSTSNTVYRRPETPPSADYRVGADLYAASILGSGGIIARFAGSTSQARYRLRYLAGSGWQIHRLGSTGTSQQLTGNIADAAVVVGSIHAFALEVITEPGQARIRAYVRGALLTELVDISPVTAAGYAGIEALTSSASDSTGFHLDNFYAEEIAVIVAGTGDDVAGQSDVTGGAGTQVQRGAGADVAGQAAIDAGAGLQTHRAAGTDTAGQAAIDAGAASQVQRGIGSDTAGQAAIDTGAASQVQRGTGSDATGQTAIDTGAGSQTHRAAGTDIDGRTDVDSGSAGGPVAIVGIGGDVLGRADVSIGAGAQVQRATGNDIEGRSDVSSGRAGGLVVLAGTAFRARRVTPERVCRRVTPERRARIING